MYGGPPPDLEELLPLTLELEFLISVGAGRPQAWDGSGAWQTNELMREELFSNRQYFYDLFTNHSGGEINLDAFFACLTKGEDNKHMERLQDARHFWLSWSKRNRRDAINDALSLHNLPLTREARVTEFIKWGQQLKLTGSIVKPRRTSLEVTERLSMLGFSDLRTESKAHMGFRRYLSDDVLRYFSRDDYAEAVGSLNVDLSEKEVLKRINDDASGQVILISGPGGVGKTRLANHLCTSSNADIALSLVNPNLVDYTGLYDALDGIIDRIDHVALFIDYAENVHYPVPLNEFQDLAQSNLNIRTSIILCSRTSGEQRVQDVFQNTDIVYQIGTQTARNTISYEEWLADQILSSFDLSDQKAVKAICRCRPVLAAFAGYLAQHHPNNFEVQFSIPDAGLGDNKRRTQETSGSGYAHAIIEDDAFQKWLRKRLKSFEVLGPMGKRRAAEIALSLPFQGAEDQARIASDPAKIGDAVLEILEDDGWIDRFDNELKNVVHDTLADGLISEHIFSGVTKARSTKRVRELLHTAAEKEYFGRALQTLDRVISDEKLILIDAVKLIEGLATSHGQVVQMCALDLLRSKLVSPVQIPMLLESVPAFCEGLDNDIDAYAELSRLVRSLRRQQFGPPDATKYPRFFALLSKAAQRADSRTLANLVSFDPAGLDRRSVLFIQRNKSKYDTRFVIEAYLKSNLDPSVIGPHVLSWLEKFIKLNGASYVLRAWFCSMDHLLKHGETENPALRLGDVMKDKLKAWCTHFNYDLNASFALQTLIEQRGFQDSADQVETWIAQHGETYNASHVLQKVLQFGKGLDPRALEWVKTWLRSPVCKFHWEEANYIFRDLRKCVLEHKTIQFEDFSEILLSHLTLEGPLHERRDMCRYWLEMGGESEDVKDTFQELVQKDITDPDVRFCFEAWSNTQTDYPMLFKTEMKLWLDNNAAHPKASYVIDIWDKLGIDMNEISIPMRTWLQNNSNSSVYLIFLAKYNGTAPKKAFASGMSEEKELAFLRKEEFSIHENHSIEFFLQSNSVGDKKKSNFKEAIDASRRYLQQYGGKVASAFLIATILRKIGNVGWIRSYADNWLVKHPHRHRSSVIYQALLTAEQHPETLIEGIKDWFVENSSYKLAGGLLLAWVESGCDPDSLKQEAKRWLCASAQQVEYPGADEVKTRYEL